MLTAIKQPALVSSGCHNKYHRPGGLNNEISHTVLEDRKYKINVPPDLVPSEALFLAHRQLSSHCPHAVERSSSGVSSYKVPDLPKGPNHSN